MLRVRCWVLYMVGMSYIVSDIAVWVMKEQGVLSNERGLTLLGLEAKDFKEFFIIGILDDGRVLMMNFSNNSLYATQ